MTEDAGTRPTKATSPKTNEPLALTIDWDLYGEYLEDSDMSDAEKREFIEVLWSIVVSFVDLGFGVHSAQLATKDCCEQIEHSDRSITTKSASVVNCLHTAKAEIKSGTQGNVAVVLERSPE